MARMCNLDKCTKDTGNAASSHIDLIHESNARMKQVSQPSSMINGSNSSIIAQDNLKYEKGCSHYPISTNQNNWERETSHYFAFQPIF